MRIAVTYDNGNVGQHFGKTEAFKLYDVEDGKVVRSEIRGTDGKGHAELIPVVASLHADAMICGGVGMPMRNAIVNAGMELYIGVTGSADQAVADLLAGALVTDDTAVHACSHDHHE